MQIQLPPIESNLLRRNRQTNKSTSNSRNRSARIENPQQTSSFQVMMDEVLPLNEDSNIDLNRLWKALPQTERTLLEYPSPENLKIYQKLILQIANTTIKKNTLIRKMKKIRPNKGNQVELSVVSFIDKRLQNMANIMHSPKNSAFTILKNIEEIRGMLRDILQ